MIVVCIPARNEEKTIAGVLVEAKSQADKIIVCDDGSTDLTGRIADTMGAEVIRKEAPSGYGAALSVLFKRAIELQADVMVTLDADAQHDPSEISRLVTPILNGEADIVIGSRFLGNQDGAFRPYRKLGIGAITHITGATTGLPLTDAQTGFRAYSGKAIQRVLPVELGMGASVEILMKAAEQKLRVVEVPAAAISGASARNPIYHGLDVVASILKFVSIRHPLLFYGILGLATMLIGLIYGLYAIPLYAAQSKPVTNVALLSEAIVTAGMLLVFMAIILFTLSNLIKEKQW